MFVCGPEGGAPETGASLLCACHSPAFARITARLSRRAFLCGAAAAAFRPGLSQAAVPAPPSGPIAFTRVALFDGTGLGLRRNATVIVNGNKIAAVDTTGAQPGTAMRVIDGTGRTLIPGLIDAHVHMMMSALSLTDLLTADIGYINLVAAREAERMLLRGFTTVRDMAGPSFGLKRAIDAGVIAGPRIFPSGAMISQTSGHGDFRMPYEIPAANDAALSRGEAEGAGMIADGVDQVLKRVREQLMQGASQVKLAAGGGIASNYDPLDVSQYTEPEFRAAVDAAENWGTYVTVHAYLPRAIQTAIRGGVRCIEHGQLMNEATAKLLADRGIWLSSQPFLDDQDANPYPPGSASRAKQIEMSSGTDRAYNLARKYKLRTAWGTDTLFAPQLTARQGAKLAKMKRWYGNAEILRMATGVNADLLAMSGPRNPYLGRLGVIAPGAYADLLLVKGDPLANIDLIADPMNFDVIMKDGRIYKAT